MPFVRVTTANTCKVRTCTFGAPLERVVILRFRCQRVVAVTFDLIAHRADHLRVADIAAFTDVDFTTRQLQRGVGAHALYVLDGVLQIEERSDFYDPADGNYTKCTDQKQGGVLFQNLVFIKDTHFPISLFCSGDSSGSRHALAKCCHPQVVGHDECASEVENATCATQHIHREFRSNGVSEGVH